MAECCGECKFYASDEAGVGNGHAGSVRRKDKGHVADIHRRPDLP